MKKIALLIILLCSTVRGVKAQIPGDLSPSIGNGTVTPVIFSAGANSPHSYKDFRAQSIATSQKIAVTWPIPGKKYAVEDTVNITWTGAGTYDYVNIDLLKNGTFVKNVVTGFRGAAQYTYTFLKSEVADGYQFRVTVEGSIIQLPKFQDSIILSIDWSKENNLLMTTGKNLVKFINFNTDSTRIYDFYDKVNKINYIITDGKFHHQDENVFAINIHSNNSNQDVVQIYSYDGKYTKSVGIWKKVIDSLNRIDFSPNGQYVIATRGDSVYQYLWAGQGNTTTLSFMPGFPISLGVSMPGFDNYGANDAKFSPDGSTFIVVGGYSSNGIIFWRKPGWWLFGASGSKIKDSVHSYAIFTANDLLPYHSTLAWHASSSKFVADAIDGTTGIMYGVQVWNTSGTLLWTKTNHTQPVVQIDWSKDGKYIAAVGAEGLLTIWDENGALLHSKQFLPIGLTDVKFSRDSKRLAFGDMQGNLYIINNVPLWATGVSHPDLTATSSGFDVKKPTGLIDILPTGILDYGDVNVNESKGLQITISNTGNIDVYLTGLEPTPPVFGFTTITSMPDTIKPGQKRIDFLNFKPTTEGSITGEFTISIEGMQPKIIPLKGNGINKAPKIETVQSLDFVTSCKQKTNTLSIKNTGNAVLNISEIRSSNISVFLPAPLNYPISIQPNSSTEVKVNYYPNAPNASQSGTLTIKSNAGDNTISLNPIKKTVQYSATSLDDKGVINLGTLCGTSDTTIIIKVVNSGDFQPNIWTNKDTTKNKLLSPLNLPVKFTIPNTGDFKDSIVVENDECDFATFQKIYIVGYAGESEIQVDKDLSFTTTIDGTAHDALTIKNSGKIPTYIDNEPILPAKFSFDINYTYPLQIKVGESITLPITYNPTSQGDAVTAKSVPIGVRCGKSNYQFTLSGTILSQAPGISIDVLDFGKQLIKNSVVKTLRIKNTSTKDFSFTNIEITNNTPTVFQITPPSIPLTIKSNDSLDIPVTFTPESVQSYTTTLTLSSAFGKTQGILKGEGIEIDHTKDKIITVYMNEAENKGTLHPKDSIEVRISATSSEVNAALDAFNQNSNFNYILGLQWNRKMFAFIKEKSTINGVSSISEDGSSLTITKAEINKASKSTPNVILQQLFFEVLWGETDTTGSIAFTNLSVEQPKSNNLLKLWSALDSNKLVFIFDPTCNNQLRGGEWKIPRTPTITFKPNPVNENVTATLSDVGSADVSDIEVYTNYGTKVLTYSCLGSDVDMNFSELSSGQYTVIAHTPLGLVRSMVMVLK